jgi:hypothetical protein
MKRCGRCERVLPSEEFHRSSRGLQAWCKRCRREYDAEYWRRTRDKRLKMRKLHRRDLVEWYRQLKAGRPCADCGRVFHHAAMQWDSQASRSGVR